jgi:hypothetical protein
MKKKKIQHCQNNSKINNSKINNSKINNTNHRNRSLSWLDTDTSIKSGWIKLVL